MTRDIERLAERWGWWFAVASTVFWVLLWPLAVPLLAVWLIRRHRSEDRVTRLMRWYPAAWRERHGDEFAALLHDMIEDGRGGLRLSLDVIRGGLAERVDALDNRTAVGTLCWATGPIALVPQGIVPLVMLATEVPSRSWFLALYVPAPFNWLVAYAMILLGLALLATAVLLTRRVNAETQAT